MRSWIWGGTLAAMSACGLYLTFAGVSSDSHCGPCLAKATAANSCASGVCPTEDESNSAPMGVVEVIDLPAALAKPAKRPEPVLPFVSFEEPPLARPLAALAPTDPMIVPAGFVEPALEMAPPPRPVEPAKPRF